MSSSTSSQSRDASRDRAESLMLKHQHSFSDSGRTSVPMWDSSDPDRAPPPLPLNPGTSSSPATRPNVSARIEEAAAIITARARDNAPSSYTTNAVPSGSPEKGVTKPQHRRMQSVQSISVRGISDSLERRSPDKGLRTSKLSDYEEYRASRSPERSPTRSGSETPTPSGRATPSHLNRPILGENTPPSATMLALQTMRNRQEAEAPLANITNSSASSLSRIPQTYDAISAQILSLTSIATNLQREMSQLSRRSKDNATDLYSLKEATNARDEDIRKSLKDLVSGLDNRFTNIDTKLSTTPEAARSTPNLGLYLDSKAHNMTPARKVFSLPRIPSPPSFTSALDRDLTESPSLVSSDGAASIALLDKVLREMATKDGQERIFSTLESVKLHTQARLSNTSSNSTVVDPDMMRKLEEILVLMKEMKENPASRALVKATGGANGSIPSQVDLYFEEQPKSGQLSRGTRETDSGASQGSQRPDFVNEEIMKLLKNVKQSLAQGGGLTNEVKALVRELRGEVLGMGREIARKLDQAELPEQISTPSFQGPSSEEIVQIVENGLADLREHMQHLIRENRRQSSGSVRSVVDTQEVVQAVRSALAEMPRQQETSFRDPTAEREELLVAIKEAWEDCKPEIALEHFGLERDEILDTLKEGLKSYQPQQQSSREVGVTYEEVLDAVQKGLSNFKPPPIETEAGATREEILMTVRECLEGFEFPMPAPAPAQARELDISRAEILETIQEGLARSPPVTKEIEFNREDLFDAMRACLEGESNPLGGMGERVLESMHDFLGTMKTEFQQYSAANGKDTEQVLDAMKDGFEELRADIESYVDRAADVTGKDEIIDVVKAGFQAMQADLDKGFASRPTQRENVNTADLLDAMEKEFEHLRDSISKSLARANPSDGKDEILDAIRDLTDDRQSSLSSNSEDTIRLVKEELEHMRTTLASTLVKSGGSIEREEVLDAIREGLEANRNPRKDGNESILSNTSELLDAFQEGVDGLRSDMRKFMDRPVDLSASYEILDTLKAGLESVRSDIERLHQTQTDFSETATARGREVVVHDENLISTEIEGLKVMITQLRIKVEALDNMPPPPMMPAETRIHRDDLDDIHAAIKEVHQSVNHVRSAQEVPLATNAASKDDTDAIETLLRNVKAKLEDFTLPEVDLLARTSHLDSLEDMLKDIKTTVEDSASQVEEHSVPKEDFSIVELLLKEVAAGVEDLQSKVKDLGPADSSITKADIQAVESLCLDTKTQIEELLLPDIETLPTKEDISSIKDAIKSFQEQIEAENELTAQAFEARKVEHGGLATKIDDVTAVIGDLRDELISRLDGSEEGIVELSKVLGMHHDSMSTYATAASMTELADLVNKEFERHMDHHISTKQLAEERDVTMFTKHDEVTADLKSKIEDKFSELMTKYDDAQISNDSKLDAMSARDQMHMDAMNSTKAVVDDLKLLIDTLGTTVTETCDRMSDDSKTLFTGVDDVNAKLGNLHSTNAHEHGLTREEVAKTLTAALRVEGSMHEHQPAIMAALGEILGLIGQHYEHSQQQSEHFSRATEEIKTGVNLIPSAIPALLPAPPAPVSPPVIREIPVQKEYDDSQVHDKLNNLISHTAVVKEAFLAIDNHHKTTQESLASVAKLDDIHEQIMATAGEVSVMVATQTRLMAEHHDSRASEAAEAAIALEKRTAQKEQVEADIIALGEEKGALLKSMAGLRKEQEELSIQTKRLTRDVAKLETALSIRQEEMKDMDARAETLERRILEGVMNHARSVHISKPSKKSRITPQERDRAMSLKRVLSTASNTTTKTSIKDGGSSIGSAVGMALKKRTPLNSALNSSVSSRTSGVDRRILSTSNVTGNRGRDTPSRALMLAPTANTGLVSLKRSHSVRSNPSSYFGGRKASWNGTGSIAADKENLVLDEEQEDDGSVGDDTSDAGTERRTSYGTSVMYTDSNLTYGTGSSMSTSGNRTASYASSIGGAIGEKTESIAEEDEEDEEDEDLNPNHVDQADEAKQDDESAQIMKLLQSPSSAVGSDQVSSMAMATFEGPETHGTFDGLSDLQPPRLITGDDLKYQQPSDSGLGTEPGTATFEHMGEAQEYFNMSRQDTNV